MFRLYSLPAWVCIDTPSRRMSGVSGVSEAAALIAFAEVPHTLPLHPFFFTLQVYGWKRAFLSSDGSDRTRRTPADYQRYQSILPLGTGGSEGKGGDVGGHDLVFSSGRAQCVPGIDVNVPRLPNMNDSATEVSVVGGSGARTDGLLIEYGFRLQVASSLSDERGNLQSCSTWEVEMRSFGCGWDAALTFGFLLHLFIGFIILWTCFSNQLYHCSAFCSWTKKVDPIVDSQNPLPLEDTRRLCCASEEGFCQAGPEGKTMTIGYSGYGAAEQSDFGFASTQTASHHSPWDRRAAAAQDKSFPVVKEVYGGLLQVWNSSCSPAEMVQVNDRLIEVDGQQGSKTEPPWHVRGDGCGTALALIPVACDRHRSASIGSRAEELCDRLQERKDAGDGVLELKFRRPREKKVVLSKTEGKEFGITLNYFKSASKVLIAGLDEDGLVQDWNLAHPETPVKRGDVIIEVNGLRDDVTKMVLEMKNSEQPSLTLLEY
eukprot:g31219.t1